MLKNLDHVAIVVESIEAAMPIYRDLLGLEYLSSEVAPDGTVKAAFFKAGGSKIELVEPIDNPGVEKFLQTRGGGLHHVCYETDDIEAELTRLKEQGVRLVDEAPRPGALGKRIAFVHPKSLGGVLVELAEKPEGTTSDV